MTPDPTAQDETAYDSDDSAADGIEGNHSGQHKRQDNAGSAALPVTLGAYEDDFREPEEERGGEQCSAGLREPKPTAEPSPVASQQHHARNSRSGERTPFCLSVQRSRQSGLRPGWESYDGSGGVVRDEPVPG
jgi:hypothetical protein